MNETNPPHTNGLAVASLVLGIFAVTGLGPLTGIPAIITGAMGLKNPTNKGLALAGIIMGVVSIIFLVLIVLFFVIIIGIGASAACDGQVLVLEDMLGLSPRTPKFVRRYGDLGPAIEAAIKGYAADVRSRAFPGPEHVYEMKKS